VLLPAPEPGEQVGRGGERLVLVGLELEHALERLQRARRIAEPVAADQADLEAARVFRWGSGARYISRSATRTAASKSPRAS